MKPDPRPARPLTIVADPAADLTGLLDAVHRQAPTQRIEAIVLVPAGAERHAALVQVALLNAGAVRCETRAAPAVQQAA
jgi:hypothetical protein